jgi:two-component system, sporulation sensor kinase D
MHNTFRTRLLFAVFSIIAIWGFLWYTHSLVERLNRSARNNAQAIARLWAGVQYPLSIFGDQTGIMSCTVCGDPLKKAVPGSPEESLYCPVCDDTTRFIETSRLLPWEREAVVLSTRMLFADLVQRLDFPTIFSDRRGNPQIVDGRVTDGMPPELIREARVKMEKLAQENEPVPIVMASDTIGYLYYGLAGVNTEMKLIPLLELAMLLLIAGIIFLLLRSELNREKELSWVGFARETAHQISTPLSSIMGWLALLEDDEDSMRSGETRDAVEHMKADVERLSRITERYGQMGRKPRLHALPPAVVVEEIVSYFNARQGLLGRGVTLEYTSRCNGVSVMGNQVLLGWVLENLVKNAVAACADSPEGGVVSISCEMASESSREVEILVSDQGKGIPYGDQGRVFKAGFTTRKGGWGLGLSLARRIVEEYHHGRLRLVSSTPGRGTVFSIVLPVVSGGGIDNDSLGR